MPDYSVKLTDYGRAAIAQAETSGTPIVLAEIAVGDSQAAPTATNTALGNEVHRTDILEAVVDTIDPGLMRFTATIPADIGGFWIREVGVFDNAGGLVYVAAFPEEYKPLLPASVAKECVIHLLCTVGNAANVNVSIDPSAVAATRSYVGLAISDRFRAPQDKGAVGDGTADDTAPIDETITDPEARLREYKVTAYSNPYGYKKVRDGLIHNRTTGRVHNPLHHEHQLIFGVETLQHWFSKCKGDGAKQNASRSNKKILMSGDSTTYGYADNPGYTPAELVAAYAKTRGYANVTVLNYGQSGHHTDEWDATYVTAELAENPDLLVARWGANDGGIHTVEQFIGYLRSGLSKVRAAKSVAELSVILMTPNSMNDVSNGRSEVWFERINAGIREAARDFQCCFIDTYAFFQNSHDGAGLWYDNIVYGIGFHTTHNA